MTALILAAALSVALTNTQPEINPTDYQVSISQPYQIEKKSKPTKKIIKEEDNKDTLDTKTIIAMTKLDTATVKTILNECKKQKVDEFLILGLLKTESSFNPTATSRNGAKGLGQITTATGRWTARRSGLTFSSRSLYNPAYNAKITINYFSYLLKTYKGDVHKALTAYNRGTGGLQSYERRTGTAISAYSQKVLKNKKSLEASYQKLIKK